MPRPAQIAIIYYSTYGTGFALAQEAAEAARTAGAEVRLRKVKETAPQAVIDGQDAWKATQEKMKDIPEAAPEDLEWADGYVFSSPTRFGGASSQMRAFIDTVGGLWAAGKLNNKTFSAMTSAENPHGGQETTLITLYITAMHWGCVLIPPGYTNPVIFDSGGNPYGLSVTADGKGLSDAVKASIGQQVKRQIELTNRLLS